MGTDMELHDVRRISGLIALYEKPIITASDTVLLAYGPVPNDAIAEMERLGVHAYASPINAAKTIAHMVERYEFLNGIPRRGECHSGTRRSSYLPAAPSASES